MTAVARDIAEGYLSLNPLVLKRFDQQAIPSLHHHLKKVQIEARAAKFPAHDVDGIRKRNTRLQRLHSAMIILENFARERRLLLA